MNKIIEFGSDSRANLKLGIDILANAVKVTLGPKGRNVIIEKTYGGPHVTKDGVSVAKEVTLKDPIQNLGASLIREAASKTGDNAGDGTTTATVLAQAIIDAGIKYIAAGANPIGLKRGMDKAVSTVSNYIRTKAEKVDDNFSQIENIATISANNDNEIGKLIAQAIKTVKTDGVITVEEAKGTETTIDVVEGMQIDRGYISSYFVTNTERMLCEMQNAYVLIVNRKIVNIKEFLNILEACASSGRQLLIIADDVDTEPLSTLVMNKLKGTLNLCVIKSPGFGERRKELLIDIATVTGATVITDNYNNETYNTSVLGSAEKITIAKDKTTIINGGGNRESINRRIQDLRILTQDNPDYKDRLASLSTGVAVIYVGAPSEVEMREKKDRVDDAVCATRAAIEEGIVPGGGVMYIRAINECLYNLKGDDEDEDMGINIIAKAIEAPLRQISKNAGKDDGIIVAECMNGDSDWGYDAKHDMFTNLIRIGIIDPAKVTRVALENAASVAGMFLTTECVIANEIV